MYIKQLYTGCLSEAAYYIESRGEAAIIDPLRDIDVYLELANERKAKIKYIFETHFHADFVSGHIDLSKATDATIIYGPGTETNCPIHIASDGEKFKIGDLTIEVMHTPGHTLESSCYLLKDETGKDHCVFTGDTLFVGDVGRPDLAQKSDEITMEALAGMMYDSLQSKIVPLGDDVIVYPAHGPGSSCGKNLGPDTDSTIGVDGRFTDSAGSLLPFNSHLLLVSDPGREKESIIRLARVGLDKVQGYLEGGYETWKKNGEQPDLIIDIEADELLMDIPFDKHLVVLDVRKPVEYAEGHLSEAINIPLSEMTDPASMANIEDRHNV